MVVDTVIPDEGETLEEAYTKWRGWAEDQVCPLSQKLFNCYYVKRTPEQFAKYLSQQHTAPSIFPFLLSHTDLFWSCNFCVLHCLWHVKAGFWEFIIAQ